ncbi:uroporphyrinogen-III synthase [Arachidicoccus ginsenosidimutans]|uniref:uroporphyrinogen-III synthase n=1 Tax=Arachidicoccus sp. BS20 TaxID=1850526 RepID=UPI0018D2B381|nr:uroporphyrinogen-III synthase [Arachidicoccus sp. BS20]
MNKFVKILSTKTIPADLLQQAKSANIIIDTISFIETKPIADFSTIAKIKQFSGEKIIAIFTSVNSVDAVFSQLNTKPDWKIFCTSGATKNALLNYVSEGIIVGAEHNASGLADKILLDKEINSYIFFCGNQRLNTLPDKLLKHNIHLEEVIVYETISSPETINEFYNGILFFSPSAVESFFSVNKIDTQTVLFSVGKTTTKAIRRFTNNTIITAVFPSAESVVKETRAFDFHSD